MRRVWDVCRGLVFIVSILIVQPKLTWSATAQVDPDRLTFPNTLVGQVSEAQSVMVLHLSGEESVVVDSLEIFHSSGNPDFRLAGENCSGRELLPGTDCQIQVRFSPQTAGNQFSTLRVFSSSGTLSVFLGGVGLDSRGVALEPKGLAFPLTVQGETSPAQAIEVRNAGTLDLNIFGIHLGGLHPDSFLMEEDCSTAPLAPSATCQVMVQFSPLTRGELQAQLTLDSNSEFGPEVIALSGKALAPDEPGVELNPEGIHFGEQGTGTRSAPVRVTIKNPGLVELDLLSLQISGSGAFSIPEVTDHCSGRILASHESCTLAVEFSPAAAGEYLGSLLVASNAPSSLDEIPLSGFGIERTAKPLVSIAPLPLSFLGVYYPKTAFQTLVLQNSGGEDLELGPLYIEGEDSIRFVIYLPEDKCSGQSLHSGATCTLQITFTPLAAGEYHANLMVPNNSPKGAMEVPLVGTSVKNTARGGCSLMAPGSPLSLLELLLWMSVPGLLRSLFRFKAKP